MPIYEFKCSQCGAEFEKLVFKIGGISEIICERCGSRKVMEKVSVFASPSGRASGAGSACAPGEG